MQSKWKPKELPEHRVEPWVPLQSIAQQGVNNELVAEF
jgi:hypothetical protein